MYIIEHYVTLKTYDIIHKNSEYLKNNFFFNLRILNYVRNGKINSIQISCESKVYMGPRSSNLKVDRSTRREFSNKVD